MPLVLSLREHQDFFVGDLRFEVIKIYHPMKFDVQDMQKGLIYDISSKHSTEICPDVFVSAGNHPQSSTVRVAIDAPSSIALVRGDKRRAMEKEGL